MDRLHLGIDHLGRVIMDKSGQVLTITEGQWRAFKDAGGPLHTIGVLPEGVDLDTIALIVRR